ncbi:hypothetical protein A2U01_0023003 [Trifolium medium]|uniref:Uncharacterized protein n=1 Tax=Trifolium medium TaxID=97028 RepID=A0A392NQ47_9FABA|nr:hypothetical protein [Trifolium medium]
MVHGKLRVNGEERKCGRRRGSGGNGRRRRYDMSLTKTKVLSFDSDKEDLATPSTPTCWGCSASSRIDDGGGDVT